MIILSFKKSSSKYFNDALTIASSFEHFRFLNNEVIIELLVKDIFERWEYFNNLFWTVVTWQGTYIEHQGMKYYSRTDKTKLFYCLQQAHTSWMNMVGDKLKELHLIYKGDITLEELERKFFIESEIDKLLDLIFKNQNDERS